MPVNLRRRAVLKGATGLATAIAVPRLSWAQDAYPSREISYLIPYNPGGMSDNISRVVGEHLAAMTGQPVVNAYRPGAGGAVAANYFAGLEPDGYTLLQSTNSFYAVIPFVTQVEYDPLVDFTPLVVFGDAPMVIATNGTVPATTLPELIAYARAHPGDLAFGTAGPGTVGHLCGLWLQRAAGIEMIHVPYNGAPAALLACVSGETQLFFGPESAEHITSGDLVGLGVMGDRRWDRLPDVPSTVESGLEGWAPRSWHTLTVLTTTPEPVKERLATLLADILDLPEVDERIRTFGLIPPGRLTREEVLQRAIDDNQQFGQLIQAAGLMPQ